MIHRNKRNPVVFTYIEVTNQVYFACSACSWTAICVGTKNR